MNDIPFVVPLVLLTILLLVFILFIIFGRLTYQLSEKETFSFRNRFPHELYYQKNKNIVSYFRILIIAFMAILLACNITYITSFKSEPSVIFFVVTNGVFFSLSILSSLFLFMVKPNYLTQFKIYSILTFVFNIMGNGMLGFLQINKFYSHFSHIIIGVFAFIMLGINVLLALNPKLKNWDKLDEVDNGNGTLSYVRPKISWLAFSIWISFLTLVIGQALQLISMILSSLGY